MPLPNANETPRLKELNAIFEKTPVAELIKWPLPTEADLALFGAITMQYSYIDLNLRRIADSAEHHGFLKSPTKVAVPYLRIGKVEDLVTAFPDWSPQNLFALGQIKEKRGVRNLVAHFGARRFPNDDAYLFLTRSAFDYKQVYGEDPPILTLFTVIAECQALQNVRKQAESLQAWLADIAPELEKMFAGAPKPPGC